MRVVIHLLGLLDGELVHVHSHVQVDVAEVLLVFLLLLLLLLLVVGGCRGGWRAVLVHVADGGLLLRKLFLFILSGSDRFSDGTVPLLQVDLMQELVLRHSEEVVLDKRAVALVVGLPLFLFLLLSHRRGFRRRLVFWNRVQVGSHIEPVYHDVAVSLPWHHGDRAVSCLRNGQVNVYLAAAPMQLQKLCWVLFNALVELLSALGPLLEVDEHAADLALLLARLVPHVVA